MPDIVKEAVESPEHVKFEVQFSRKSVVKALNPLPEPFSVTLSNLDLLSGRFPVTYLYFYPKPELGNFAALVDALKSSLSQTLDAYYPFAGRIVENPETNEPEIICDNNGALVIEAHADVSLKKLDFYDLNETIEGKLVSVQPAFPVQIQVTDYTCGSISITFSFDHALGDGSAFGKFIASWSEIAQNKPISCLPDHTRHLRARFPPKYHPSLDQTFTKCSLEEIQNMPMNGISLKRLYHINASSINMLQKLASDNGIKRTKIEAFSAYVWKIMISAVDKKHEKCKMGWLVDGRERLNSGGENCMSNYIGNVLSLAFGEATLQELKEASIADIANNVHEAISKVSNEAHFLDLIDWIECHRPGLMLAKAVLGLEGPPALVLSSGRRFPVSEVDFGFGSPLLGTVYTSVERIGVGYMNQRQSAVGDGSWTVSAILWPELAAVIEADPIFQPMSAAHLQL